MRLILISLLFSNLIQAETLDLLAIEVDQRLVEPTLARSLAGDRAGLDDAITKLRKLAPDKGVVEHASVSRDFGPALKNPIPSGIQFGPDMPGRGAHYREFGYTLTCDSLGNLRVIEIKPPASLTSAPLFKATLVHPLDDRWSLSAAITTPKGALFIFEKIIGRPPLEKKPIWVAASLLGPDQTKSNFDTKPERWLSSNTFIRSAILQAPVDADSSSSITSDLKPFAGAWRNYTQSTATFSAFMGAEKDAGKVISKVDFRYLENIEPLSHNEYSGSFRHAIGIDKLPISTSNLFTIRYDIVELKGTMTTSTPQTKKKPDQRQLQTLVFRRN
jgi:hypothetical protein